LVARERVKVQNVQALRGAAILLVVVYHTWTIERRYGGGPGLLSDWVAVGLSGVDLFFVISGFIMVTVTKSLVPGLTTATNFLYHRAARIYPIYWIYSLMLLPIFLVRPDMVNSSQGNQVDLLASFLLLPQRLLPLLQVGWTLVHEIYFYLIFALFLSIKRLRLAVGLMV
jgi:peptidoglycan/LPS O-acetylase OafA/YrhL